MKEVMRKQGFTLVELLVVLVVIGILIAIILPNALRAIDQANRRETASVLRSIDTAAQLCYATERAWTNCNTLAKLSGTPADGGQPYLPATTPASSPFGVPYTMIQEDAGSGASGAGAPWVSDKAPHFPNWPSLSD